MEEQSWQGPEVAITGALGFLGCNLAARLVTLGARVRLLDIRTDDAVLAQLPEGPGEWDFLCGDIQYPDYVTEAIRGVGSVFHLAGTSGAEHSNVHMLESLEVNCRGSLILLSAMREFAPEATLVFPSSRLVYGRAKALPLTEDHELAPASLYAVHKLTVERYMTLFRSLYGIRGTVLRFPNPYGPGQPHPSPRYSVVNWLVKQAVEGETLKVYGEGAQLRDYLYVGDVTEALLAASGLGDAQSCIYNVGADSACSFLEMVETLCRITRTRYEKVPWPEGALKVETGDSHLSSDRFRRATGWAPTADLRSGLELTVDYYRNLKRLGL
jgi:UDP-glucose 4-epimerase